MTRLLKNPWVWVLAGWVGLIFFSSTSFVGNECELAFNHLSQMFMPPLDGGPVSERTVHFLAHKIIHVCLFSILGMLLWKVLPDGRRKIAVILLIGAIIGSCSELLQRFFPDRNPAISDLLINIGGTAVGITASLTFVLIRARSLLRRRAELIGA